MILLALLLGHALASGLPQWPESKPTVPGECSNTFGLTKGLPIDSLLIGSGSLARCSAVVEPLTSYAHLLAIESHAKQVRSIYELDVTALTYERDHWKREATRARPWHSQPWFVAVTVSALVTGALVAYDWKAGGQ